MLAGLDLPWLNGHLASVDMDLLLGAVDFRLASLADGFQFEFTRKRQSASGIAPVPHYIRTVFLRHAARIGLA
jgi:hypothetical protein